MGGRGGGVRKAAEINQVGIFLKAWSLELERPGPTWRGASLLPLLGTVLVVGEVRNEAEARVLCEIRPFRVDRREEDRLAPPEGVLQRCVQVSVLGHARQPLTLSPVEIVDHLPDLCLQSRPLPRQFVPHPAPIPPPAPCRRCAAAAA